MDFERKWILIVYHKICHQFLNINNIKYRVKIRLKVCLNLTISFDGYPNIKFNTPFTFSGQCV